MNRLLKWWRGADADERHDVAQAAEMTPEVLRQAAHAYRTDGAPALSPDAARRVEHALGGRVLRSELCPACGRCEFAPKAKQSRTRKTS